MARKSYQSDLSDTEWSSIEPLLPARQSSKGRTIIHERREILNAIFWMTAAGCAWRMLAHDFPAWQTVYHYFRRWRKDGTWKRIHDDIYAKPKQALAQSIVNQSKPLPCAVSMASMCASKPAVHNNRTTTVTRLLLCSMMLRSFVMFW